MKLFQKNSIWGDIFLMSSGTIIAQAINVLIQPILTRIVSPDALGIYTYIISLATMIIPVASLKLDMLIVSEKDDNEAQYITDVSIFLCFIISLLYVIVISVGYFLPSINAFNRYGLVIYFVPLIVLTNGIRFLFISYNNRYREYKLIASIGIIREGAKGVLQILSGFFRFGALGQIVGYAIAPIFGLSVQTKGYREKLKNRTPLTMDHFKSTLLCKGKDQILYLVPAQFVNSFSHALVIMSISALYSASSLGYYSAGTRLLEIPLVFITANVSKVCYRQISSLVANEKPVLGLVSKISIALFIIALSGFGLLYFIAPPCAEFVFGKGYYVAGEYMRCLCVMYVVRFVAASFAGLFTIFNKQNIELLINGLFVLFAAIIYIICKRLDYSITSYLWLISICYAAVYGYLLLRYFMVCKKYDKSLSIS